MTRLQRQPPAYHSAGESSNSRSGARNAFTSSSAPPSYSSRPSSMNDVPLPDYPANPLFANLPSTNNAKAPPVETQPAQLEAQLPARPVPQSQPRQAQANRPAARCCRLVSLFFFLVLWSLFGFFVIHGLLGVGSHSGSDCKANPGQAGCESYKNSTTNATMSGQ